MAKPLIYLFTALLLAQCGRCPDASSENEATYRGQPVAYWMERLKEELPKSDFGAISAVVALAAGSPEAQRELLILLDDQNQGTRFRVAAALIDLQPKLIPTFAPALVKNLDSEIKDEFSIHLIALTELDMRVDGGIPEFREFLTNFIRRKDIDQPNLFTQQAWQYIGRDVTPLLEESFDVSLHLAKAGARLTERDDGFAFRTLAWAYFRNGRVADAIRVGEELLAQAKGSSEGLRMEVDLDHFRKEE